MDFDQYGKLLVLPPPRQRRVFAPERKLSTESTRSKSCAARRGFVALQVADQVPGRVEIGERRGFALEFLNAILAEVAQAGVVGGANRLGRERFRNRDEGDFVGVPAGALRGARAMRSRISRSRFAAIVGSLSHMPDSSIPIGSVSTATEWPRTSKCAARVC